MKSPAPSLVVDIDGIKLGCGWHGTADGQLIR